MTPPRAPLMPLDDALARLLAQALPLPGVDTMRTFDADGRVLAHDLVSALQVPPLDNSAMDGYALRCADVPQPGTVLPVSQRIPAGRVGTPLQPGTAARIFTGAPVPEGADAVVMQEECSAEGDGHVRVQATPRAGQNIRLAGENITRGSVVLQAGARLTPAALGLAASIGVAELPVARRPRVALFSTGDELAMPGEVAPEQLPPGAIYNSNRFFLHALLQRMGCEVTDMGIVPDRLDHIKPAVQALGQLDLWQIAIKPGKPFAYGRVGPAHFVGLPGNPVASFITFAILVRPFLLRLQGVRDVAPRGIAARADFDWPKADKRREFLRVRYNAAGALDLFTNQGSGVLTSTVWGDGVVDNPPGQTIARGDTVRFHSFAEMLS